MFERIKCYKHLRKMEKFLCSMKQLGEITHDEQMIQEADTNLHLTMIIKKEAWHNRKMAKDYNLKVQKHGF